MDLGNPAQLQITGDMTIEMWLRPDDIGHRRNPYSKAVGGEGTIYIEESGTLSYYYGTDGEDHGPYQGISSVIAIESDIWQHIAIVRDLTNMELRWYINGQLTNSEVAIYSAATSGTNHAFIGKGYVFKYEGEMDEFRIWNLARTQAEIEDDMYAELIGNENGLVAYYTMDIEAGALTDLTSYTNHGTISGVEPVKRYRSVDCFFLSGGTECPFPTIQSAMLYAQGGNDIFIRGGRYSEYVEFNTQATEEKPIILKPFPGELVIMDGTVPILSDWEPYDNGGYTIYRTRVDSAAIAEMIGKEFTGIHQLFMDGRMMMPAQEVNFKNPTDPTTGTPTYPEPGTVWEVQPGVENQTNLLEHVDSPEEWSYDSTTMEVFLFPEDGQVPDGREVRGRVFDRILQMGERNIGAEYITFEGIEFFAGSFYLKDTEHITFEDCRFSFSTELDSEINMVSGGSHVVFRNCVFEYINGANVIRITRCDDALIENCYFHHNGWTSGTWEYINNDRSYDATFRYVTVENAMSPGIFVGMRSLTEYCLIRNLYDKLDGAGLQRNNAATYLSTTRYCWIINCPAINGVRFDSSPGGTYGKIHHVVSVRNRRGFRLKGDHHKVYHLTAYDSQTNDIRLDKYKYTDNEGNFHTDFANSIAGIVLTCDAPNCSNRAKRDSAGIWWGWEMDYAKPQLELATFISRYQSQEEERYDFRPRKGSAFIDAGTIVDSINDGQGYSYYHSSMPGQNRRFVGDAPDIGAYEYGDSVYWIPGYRYPYPSFPIPRDGADKVQPDYSLVWNYPYKRDYSNTQATIMVSGPGVYRTETFNYPNNVLFESFQPMGIYTWSVAVDGKSGGTWSFMVDDKVYPISDRSIDITQDGSIDHLQIETLTVSQNDIAFLKFDVPASIDNSWKILLNLFTGTTVTDSARVVLYTFDNTVWSEQDNEQNIGMVDHTLGEAIDTLTNLAPTMTCSLDLSSVIDGPGLYSFALAPLDSRDRVVFWSKEKRSGGTKLFIPGDEAFFPHLSFLPGIGSVKIVLSEPRNDSTIVIGGSTEDSIRFSWRHSHALELDDMNYRFRIKLPFANAKGGVDTLTIDNDLSETSATINKASLLGMLMEANLPYGTFYWDVIGNSGSMTIRNLESYRFNLVTDDSNYEGIFPDEYGLHHNYPNPFNAITTIVYDLAEWSQISLIVYDIVGHNVNVLASGPKAIGRHRITWYGRDKHGKNVPSGIYFYHLIARDPNTGRTIHTETKKMMHLK